MESNYLNFSQRKRLSAVFVTIKITQNKSIIGAIITLMVFFLLIVISNGHLNLYFRKLKNKEYKVACPANTLVIANVHGFHKRGESISGVERSLIRIPLRYNPLGPIGSIPSNLYSGSFF